MGRREALQIRQRWRSITRLPLGVPPPAREGDAARGRRAQWCLKTHRLSCQWALMESVDCWPLAIILTKTLGGKPRSVSGFSCDRWKVSSSWVAHVTVPSGVAFGPWTDFCGGPSPGELSGGNWMALEGPVAANAPVSPRASRCSTRTTSCQV